jgi:hypothetical protein
MSKKGENGNVRPRQEAGWTENGTGSGDGWRQKKASEYGNTSLNVAAGVLKTAELPRVPHSLFGDIGPVPELAQLYNLGLSQHN